LAETAVPSPNRPSLLVEGAVKRELEAAGWESEVGKGGTIWRNPIDAHWYDELRALAILKGAWIRGIPLEARRSTTAGPSRLLRGEPMAAPPSKDDNLLWCVRTSTK
jgi:hypothetical protein